MKFEKNQEKFDKRQSIFTLELAKIIKFILDETDIEEYKIKDITENLLFNIGALLDASNIVGTEKEPVISHLSFRENEDLNSNLIISPVCSYIHEIAISVAEEVSKMSKEDDYP